jgi:hypothetical protein
MLMISFVQQIDPKTSIVHENLLILIPQIVKLTLFFGNRREEAGSQRLRSRINQASRPPSREAAH